MRSVLLAAAVLAVAAAWWLARDGDRGERRPEREPAPAKKPRTDGAAADATDGAVPPAAARARTGDVGASVRDVTGNPAAGVVVEIIPARELLADTPPRYTTTTATDGTVMLEVPGGVYWLRAVRGGEASTPVMTAAVSDGAARPAALTLQPARGLRGIVLDPDGAPVAGARVVLAFTHAGRSLELVGTTDPGGGFAVPALPDTWFDHVRILVQPKTLPMALFGFGRESLLGGVLTLRVKAVRLRARVVGEAGLPIRDARVQRVPASLSDPTQFFSVARTDEDGRFDVLEDNVAGETFVIRAAGYAAFVWRPQAGSGDRKVNVPEIRLRRGPALFGTVSSPDGTAIERATVRIEHPDLPGKVLDETRADAEGRFRFEAVPAEALVLYAYRTAAANECLPQLRLSGVRGGPDPLAVVLPEPIRATVRLLREKTREPVAAAFVTVVVRDRAGAEVARRAWPPLQRLAEIVVTFWAEGAYDLDLDTIDGEPVKLKGVQVFRGRPLEIPVHLVPRRG